VAFSKACFVTQHELEANLALGQSRFDSDVFSLIDCYVFIVIRVNLK
jgi:hypothetical protein